MKRLFAILLITGVVGWCVTAVFIVDETEYAIVTRFGRTVAVHVDPGLRFKLPQPFEQILRFEKRTLYQSVPEAEYLTSDKKNIVVSSFLTWRIADPEKFLTALRTREAAEARLETLVKSSLGAALGNQPFTDYIPNEPQTNNTDIASGSIAALEQRVYNEAADVARKDYGIDVLILGVSRFSFPEQNLSSVFARMRAERERIAKSYRSEGEAEAQKIIAQAQRKSAEVIAAAEANADIARGEAEAEAARIYARAYEGHQDFYEFLRTLEAYGNIIDAETTVVIPADAPLLDLLTNVPPLNKTSEDK